MRIQAVRPSFSQKSVMWIPLAAFLVCLSPRAMSQGSEAAFKIDGKTYKMEDVYSEDQASFYELEKKKFDIVDRLARDKYLQSFWESRAKETSKTVEQAQAEYEQKNLQISEKEVKSTLEQFAEHPQLKKLSDAEKEQQVRDYLKERAKRDMITAIVETGIQSGKLAILYPQPQEPVYQVVVTDKDQVRYGPNASDTKPLGCEGDKCAITIVEYSEFQCPFCNKVLPAAKQVLTDYKGKARWVTRDFPLSFHDRARPAAIAAHCAGNQGKYWEMYNALFENQRNLADEDLKKYAKDIKVDLKTWETCVANPAKVEEIINANFNTGVALGVSGTPAFFINGRRLSGALPFAEFDRVIKEELAKNRT